MKLLEQEGEVKTSVTNLASKSTSTLENFLSVHSERPSQIAHNVALENWW